MLCAFIVLGATNRLTRRQAGGAALALTVVVLAVVMVHYKQATPTDEYTLRTVPAHTGHSLAEGSVNDWTRSKRCPHSLAVHAY